MAILRALRARAEPLKEKKFDTDPDVVNELYVSGLVVHTREQISNFVNRTLKPKLFGKTDEFISVCMS
jgi:hypothetical protein